MVSLHVCKHLQKASNRVQLHSRNPPKNIFNTLCASFSRFQTSFMQSKHRSHGQSHFGLAANRRAVLFGIMLFGTFSLKRQRTWKMSAQHMLHRKFCNCWQSLKETTAVGRRHWIGLESEKSEDKNESMPVFEIVPRSVSQPCPPKT